MRVGVNYASKYKPDWLLFLDDDTVSMGNAVDRVLGLINNLPRHVLDRVGAVLMGSVDGDCGLQQLVRLGMAYSPAPWLGLMLLLGFVVGMTSS